MEYRQCCLKSHLKRQRTADTVATIAAMQYIHVVNGDVAGRNLAIDIDSGLDSEFSDIDFTGYVGNDFALGSLLLYLFIVLSKPICINESTISIL